MRAIGRALIENSRIQCVGAESHRLMRFNKAQEVKCERVRVDIEYLSCGT